MIVLVISCFQYQYWLAEVLLNIHRQRLRVGIAGTDSSSSLR